MKCKCYSECNCDSSTSGSHASISPKSRKYNSVYKCAVVCSVFVFSTNRRRVLIRQQDGRASEVFFLEDENKTTPPPTSTSSTFSIFFL